MYKYCRINKHQYKSHMRTIVVLVVKNKKGDLSDRTNYRPISLATTTAKILERLLDTILERHLDIHDSQFGFRAGLSTDRKIFYDCPTLKYWIEQTMGIAQFSIWYYFILFFYIFILYSIIWNFPKFGFNCIFKIWNI